MLITIVWVVCGVVAYGLMKGSITNRVQNARENYANYWRAHDTSGDLREATKFADDDEMTCATAFMFGPLSLISIAIGTIHAHFAGYRYKISFRFRVPEELKKTVS